jgi:hypothetical protein
VEANEITGFWAANGRPIDRLINFVSWFHLVGLLNQPDGFLAGAGVNSLNVGKPTIELFKFEVRVMLHDLIGSPAARLTEPLLRIEIPYDLRVLHQSYDRRLSWFMPQILCRKALPQCMKIVT